MVSFAFGNAQMTQTRLSLHSKSLSNLDVAIAIAFNDHGLTFVWIRELRENRVFVALLNSTAGLEDRLKNTTTEEDVISISSIVSPFENGLFQYFSFYFLLAAKRSVQFQVR